MGWCIDEDHGASVTSNALICVLFSDGANCSVLLAFLLEEAPLHNPVVHGRAHGHGVIVAKHTDAVHLAGPIMLADPSLGRVFVPIKAVMVGGLLGYWDECP